MEAQGTTPQVMEYQMSMQGLAAMGRIEAGFSLLVRAEAKGLLSNSNKDGYQMFHTLIQACRVVGDFNSVSRAQAALDRLGLTPLAPVATAVVQGTLRQYQYGHVGEGVVHALALWSELRQQKPFKPQLQAVPWGFVQSSTRKQQEESLKLNAEEKTHGEDELSVSTDSNACMVSRILQDFTTSIARPTRIPAVCSRPTASSSP